MRNLLLLAFSLVLATISANTARACHAIALVNPQQQPVTGGIQVTASSDSPTCGCDVYWLDVEVRCNNTSDPFTGGPLSPGVWVPYNSYPFFQSAQMNKPSCVVQQYPWVTIPYTGLCPGVTYKYRMRENHNGQVGPWTATFTFTVPGVQSPLQLTASATPASVCGTQTVQLNSAITGGCSSNQIISWTGGAVSNSSIANPTATVSSTTTFTVTYQDLCSNQSATASVTVVVSPPPVAGTASAAPNPICAGQTSTLTLTGSTGNVQWQSASSSTGPWTNIAGATSTTYTTPALSATTYYQAVVSNACGSVTSNVVTVNVSPAPTVIATASPATICPGQSSTLTVSGATSYSWAAPINSTNASVTVSPTTTTVYSVTGFSSTCSTTVNVTVTVNPLPAVTATASPASLCTGQSTTLTANGGSTYLWSTGATTQTTTVTPSATTTYTVTGTSAAGCTDTGLVTVTVGPPPTVTASALPAAICEGQSTTLTASGAATYDWQPGNLSGASVSVSPTVTTVYTVTGYTAPGCSSVATVTVTVNPLPVVSAAASPASICAGQSAGLTGSGAGTYDWQPINQSGTNITVSPSATTTYTVTGYSAAGCSDTATVTITVNPIPVVTATASPVSVCPGQPSLLTGGGADTYNWLAPVSQTAPSVSVTPSVTTTYTVVGSTAAGCSDTTTVTVTMNAGPLIVATASPDSICVGASSTLTATGAATYTWQPGNLTGGNVTVTPSATTTYTVTGTTAAGCQGIDSVTVVVNPIPVITASASPASVCAGGSSTLTAGGASTYQWQPVSQSGTSITVTPASTTIYTVTGTTAAGCSATANVTVTVNPAPVVTLTAAPDSICQGASSVITATGGVTYDWLPGPMSGASVTVTPSVTTTYTVSVTTSNGCSIEDSITVYVAPPITLSTTATDALCFGGNTGTATVVINGGVGTPSVVWNTTPPQNTITATGLVAGAYGVTVTDGLGCTATASVTVNEPTELTLSTAGIDATCFGACDGQLIVIPSGGTPQYSISWSPGGCLQPSCNNICAGTYSVTVTDMNGCTATDSATVSEPPQLVATLSSSTSNCNQPDGEAWASVTGGTPGYTISWSTSAGPQVNDTAYALVPGMYVATITDFNGCILIDSVAVPNAPGVQASISGSVNTTCFGACDGEATVTETGGAGPYTYSWNTSPVQNTATATGLCAGTYIATVTDSNGCTSTATVTITEPAAVVANPATPAVICIGQSTTLTSTATGGNGVYTYVWSGGSIVSPAQTTTYNVVATDSNGCVSAPANVTVTVNPPLDVIATGTDSVCPGGSTPLLATGSGGDGNYSYQWQSPAGLDNPIAANPNASPSATTTYTVYVSDGCGTPIDSATVTVTVNPLPQVVIGSDITSACEPGDPNSACINFADLSAISSGSIAGWLWDFGDGSPVSTLQNPTYCYSGDGVYPVTLTATSDQGCTATVPVAYPITIHPAPVPEFVFGPQPTTIVNPEICFTDMSTNGASWSWDFADPFDVNATSTQQNPCHVYADSGTYCVELIVTTVNGCVDSITHCLIIQPDYTIYVPSAFSPNLDNVNDTFFPQGVGLNEKTFEMFIFDRWGNMIYYTTDMNKGWDGRANQGNYVAQQDVYVWKINVSDMLGSKHQFMGHVTLVK